MMLPARLLSCGQCGVVANWRPPTEPARNPYSACTATAVSKGYESWRSGIIRCALRGLRGGRLHVGRARDHCGPVGACCERAGLVDKSLLLRAETSVTTRPL